MAEDPEQVLPQQRVAAVRDVVEVDAEPGGRAPGRRSASVSGGSAKISANDTARNAKQNSGMRLIDMPGARTLKIVTMKLTAAAVDDDAVEDQPEAVEVDVRAGAELRVGAAARS